MKKLATKIVVFFCLITIPVNSHSTGIPVVDVVNIFQTTLTAMESIAQTAKQIDQYKTQIGQYERQMKDALPSGNYLWDDANATISGLLGTMTSINNMKALVLEIDGYLDSMNDGMSDAEKEANYNREGNILNSENQSIDELITTIDSQQDSLQKDADKLIKLQEQASGEVGQMQALQTANMLSSHMGNQLLQMRSVLQAQSRADAAFRLRRNDNEAKAAAATKSIREGVFIPSSNISF